MNNFYKAITDALNLVKSRAQNTPVLPFVPAITPNSMKNAQVPLAKEAQNLPQTIRNAFPITQVPEQIQGQIQQVGRLTSGELNTGDILSMSGVAVGRLKNTPRIEKTGFSMDDIDNAIKAFRSNHAEPIDKMQAIEDITRFAREHLSKKEYAAKIKNFPDIIDALITKFRPMRSKIVITDLPIK